MANEAILQKLTALVGEALENLDKNALPHVAEHIQTDKGRKRIEDWILRLADKDGMPVGAAMAQIESELSQII